jgi:hypothetical protein
MAPHEIDIAGVPALREQLLGVLGPHAQDRRRLAATEDDDDVHEAVAAMLTQADA